VGVLSFGVEVSIHESLKGLRWNASSVANTGWQTGWPRTTGVAGARLKREPSAVSIAAQRKLVGKHFRAPFLILGSLLLVSLLLCSEVLVVHTAGSAIRLVSRIHHRASPSGPYSSGDCTDSIGRADPGR
jgi:hypothetical protein